MLRYKLLFSRKEIEMCFSSCAPLKQSSAAFKILDMKQFRFGLYVIKNEKDTCHL